MASRLQIEGDDSVLLRVTHSNLKNFATDVRFSLQVPFSDNVNYFVLTSIIPEVAFSFV